jgi:UDP-3-O-[3-hydroxymyristoyl] glucosamine N-acyltransferase
MVYGTPALNARDFNKSYVYFKNLPKVVSKINQLEKDLKIQIKK